MNCEGAGAVSAASLNRHWNWIEYALSDLSTTIGLKTQDGEHSSREEITDSLAELERNVRSILSMESRWWSEVGSRTSQATTDAMAEQRRSLIRELHDLLEAARFASYGSEWDEVRSSVEQFRTRVSKHRGFELEAARAIDAAPIDPREDSTNSMAGTQEDVQQRPHKPR